MYTENQETRFYNHRSNVEPNSSCKPLLKWPGGKTLELVEIKPRIPKHDRYFEPFFGGGAVYFDCIEKPSYLNDTHSELMKLYYYVKNQNQRFFYLIDKFVQEWQSSNDKQLIYNKIRQRYNDTKKCTVQKTIDFFILREYAYGGMFRLNSNGDFNVPFGKGYENKKIKIKIEYLKSSSVLRKLSNAKLYNTDFQEFSNDFKFTKKDFMFVDPPYNCSFTKYGENNFGTIDQERLANFLISFKGKFMLVTQYTELIKKIYASKKFITCIYDKKYRFNIKGRFNRSVKHALITNYEPNT